MASVVTSTSNTALEYTQPISLIAAGCLGGVAVERTDQQSGVTTTWPSFVPDNGDRFVRNEQSASDTEAVKVATAFDKAISTVREHYLQSPSSSPLPPRERQRVEQSLDVIEKKGVHYFHEALRLCTETTSAPPSLQHETDTLLKYLIEYSAKSVSEEDLSQSSVNVSSPAITRYGTYANLNRAYYSSSDDYTDNQSQSSGSVFSSSESSPSIVDLADDFQQTEASGETSNEEGPLSPHEQLSNPQQSTLTDASAYHSPEESYKLLSDTLSNAVIDLEKVLKKDPDASQVFPFIIDAAKELKESIATIAKQSKDANPEKVYQTFNRATSALYAWKEYTSNSRLSLSQKRPKLTDEALQASRSIDNAFETIAKHRSAIKDLLGQSTNTHHEPEASVNNECSRLI